VLTLDPQHAIVHANRSAAYLASQQTSKALADARRAVALNPKYAKGHSRLAAALWRLGRVEQAQAAYQHILSQLDPQNAAAKAGVASCLEKKAQQEQQQQEAESKQQQQQKQEQQQQQQHEQDSAETKGPPVEEKNEEDDLLDDFFSEVEAVTDKKKKPDGEEEPDNDEAPRKNAIKAHLQELGSSKEEMDRLLQRHYEWKNLNPYRVLVLDPTTSTQEDISRRYRALALLVHPDKCPEDVERAGLALEEVKKANTILQNEDKRRHVQQLIYRGSQMGQRDYNNGDKTTKSLEECEEVAIQKLFAEIEVKRRDVERRKRSQEERDRSNEDEELKKEKQSRDFDKGWRESTRVDSRVGNWRHFDKKQKKK
jgi:DnaJ family protein C protein 8